MAASIFEHQTHQKLFRFQERIGALMKRNDINARSALAAVNALNA